MLILDNDTSQLTVTFSIPHQVWHHRSDARKSKDFRFALFWRESPLKLLFPAHDMRKPCGGAIKVGSILPPETLDKECNQKSIKIVKGQFPCLVKWGINACFFYKHSVFQSEAQICLHILQIQPPNMLIICLSKNTQKSKFHDLTYIWGEWVANGSQNGDNFRICSF